MLDAMAIAPKANCCVSVGTITVLHIVAMVVTNRQETPRVVSSGDLASFFASTNILLL